MNAPFRVVDGGKESGTLSPQARVMELERKYKGTFQLIIQHLHALFLNLKKSDSSYFRMIQGGVVYAVYGGIHIQFPADMEFDEVNVPVTEMRDWEITPSNSTCQSVADILSSQNAARGSVGRSTRAIVLTRKNIKVAENDE